MPVSSSRALALACVSAAVAALLHPAAFAGGPDADTTAAQAERAERAHMTDQLIVKYRKGSAAHARTGGPALARTQELLNRSGLQMRVLRRTAQEAHVLKLDRRVDLARLALVARALADADPDVEYAEPDRLLQPMLTPNDTRYLEQWHYYEATAGLNLPAAWDVTTGAGVNVAVIDTGYRPHVDLAANIVGGYDMIIDTAVSNDGGGRDSSALDPGDWVVAGECGFGEPARNSSWHGTHVAGTIAALTNNASGVAGAAYGAKVVPIRALGKCGGYTSDIADGITWASGGAVGTLPANPNPARVINLSLGGGGACDATTQTAINGARGRGSVIVVAAGNSNANAANFSPASCSGVVTVAAVNRSGGKAYYSNFGTVVDVAAPGGDVRSAATNGVLSTLNTGTTTPGSDSYAWYQGTSMAAPHVAAAAALVIARNPALTPDQVENILKTTVRPFPTTCSQCGTGIVNAAAAVAAATGGGGGGGSGNVQETEPNNSLGAAMALSLPATVAGTMGSGDNDYFRVSVNAGATLTVRLTPPATADYDLQLFNANGTRVASSVLGTGQVDTITYRNTGASAATFYARVYYYSGGTGGYSLALSQ